MQRCNNTRHKEAFYAFSSTGPMYRNNRFNLSFRRFQCIRKMKARPDRISDREFVRFWIGEKLFILFAWKLVPLLCWNNKENHDESESLLHDDGEYDLNIYTEYSKFEYSLNLESLKLSTTLEFMQRV